MLGEAWAIGGLAGPELPEGAPEPCGGLILTVL